MKNSRPRLEFRGLFVALVAASLFVASAAAQESPEVAAFRKATVDAKYARLLAVIHTPGDKAEYGDFHDFGASPRRAWGGYRGLPPGLWVYVHPHWYIWEGARKKDRDESDLAILTRRVTRATVDGKYSRLLAVVASPDDKAEYGEFKDFGYSKEKTWGGVRGLPAGHWVYVFPHWYVWEVSK